MDLFIGIHKAGRPIGIHATSGIYRECRCVQRRQQHGHKYRGGKRIEKAHGTIFRLRRSQRRTDIVS